MQVLGRAHQNKYNFVLSRFQTEKKLFFVIVSNLRKENKNTEKTETGTE